jgi:hypothetical protein
LTTPTRIADPGVVHADLLALLAYGGWTIIIVVGVFVLIGLAIYSVFALRKEDAWEERPPDDQDWPED